MRAEGLLTDEQARALLASMSPLAEGAERRPSRKSALVTAVAVICIVGALLVLVVAAINASGGAPADTEIQNVAEMLNTPGGTGAMNKTLSALTSTALLLLPLLLVIAAFAWLYNGLVNKEERVYEAWSQVESNLQRRADLIPNLVETVSRYMQHERETLAGVVGERAEALDPLADALERVIADQRRAAEQEGVQLDDEATLARLAEGQAVLAGSLRNLVAVAESYPNLRSSDQFLALQAQLEGTENRINVARMEFNQAVGDYNAAIRRMPGTLIAGMADFKRKAYFEARDGADAPVEVNFDRD
ncbi:MAG TPA: LemA family protein [Gammaproteobacteria bacterium]